MKYFPLLHLLNDIIFHLRCSLVRQFPKPNYKYFLQFSSSPAHKSFNFSTYTTASPLPYKSTISATAATAAAAAAASLLQWASTTRSSRPASGAPAHFPGESCPRTPQSAAKHPDPDTIKLRAFSCCHVKAHSVCVDFHRERERRCCFVFSRVLHVRNFLFLFICKIEPSTPWI